MIRNVDRYTREEIRANPDVLVVFGDNMLRVGYAGQAEAARGEPNAVGIPTLYRPGDFFTDDDFEMADGPINDAFARLVLHLAKGGEVWWPSAGVGTGLARLPTHAPKILAYIEEWRKALEVFNA